MSGKPLVSIMVLVHNAEAYLDRCMDSIVNQTYGNLQIILVDDGSTDRSGAMCDEWARRDGRVQTVHQENRGVSGARNAGLELARGDYLGWVDSDDYIDQNYVGSLVDALESHPDAGVAMSTVNEEWPDTTGIRRGPGSEDRDTIGWKEHLRRALADWRYATVWKLYRASVWRNLRFVEGKAHDDEFILIDLVLACNGLVHNPNATYHYIHHSHSATKHDCDWRNLDQLEACVQQALWCASHDDAKEMLDLCLGKIIGVSKDLQGYCGKNRRARARATHLFHELKRIRGRMRSGLTLIGQVELWLLQECSGIVLKLIAVAWPLAHGLKAMCKTTVRRGNKAYR